MNSIWNGKNLTQHLRARQIHRDYPHAHNCPSHTRFKHLLFFFLPSLTIVYSVHLSAGHTQHWYSVIVQHTGASDTDSHAVCPSSITPWTMSCASRRRVHQKTQRSYGRLTRTRQAYNLYWLSWRIWKMSSWTHSILRSAFPSWKLIIWLPPAYCCGCAWKPEAAVFTCNNCLSLHRYITLLLHLWWCISLASYQLKMNLTSFTSCFLSGPTLLMVQPLSSRVNRILNVFQQAWQRTLSFLLYLIFKNTHFWQSALCDALPKMEDAAECQLLEELSDLAGGFTG